MIEVENTSFDRADTYDLLVVSGGYETRSSYVARLDVRATSRIALRLPRVEGASYGENWAYLVEADWEPVAPPDLHRWMSDYLAARDSGLPLRVAVDISSMPRHVLGYLVQEFHTQGNGVRVTFLYCPAWFETSARQAGVDSVLSAQPVSAYFAGAVRPPHLPIGLVMGLGLEPHRSDGLREFLEPARLWAFVAQGLDERFVCSVLEVNDYFLRGVGVDPIRYDIRDLAGTYRALRSLSSSAGHTFRVVLAPSGPKIFTLACLLAGVDRDIERPAVWRVGAARDPGRAVDVEATGEVVACIVRFLGEQDESEMVQSRS